MTGEAQWLQWRDTGTARPGDQERDLNIPRHWASVGPEGRDDEWSWIILRFNGDDNPEIDGGTAPSEEAAMRAVDDWEAAHQGEASEGTRQ